MPPTDPKGTVLLESYSGALSCRAMARRDPKSVEELRQIIEGPPPKDLPLTLRATGNSLHDQALGSGTIVFLEELPHEIAVRPDDLVGDTPEGQLRWPTVEATGWTPWEAVVRACLRLGEPAAWSRDGGPPSHWDVDAKGASIPPDARNVCRWEAHPSPPRLLPYVLASSGRITVGGTLSADTMWRFSGCFGKESRSVLWLDLLTYQRKGGARECRVLRLFNAESGSYDHRAAHASPEVSFAADRAENDELFHAVIGGFGALGPILRAKYLLLELDEDLTHEDFHLYDPPLALAQTPDLIEEIAEEMGDEELFRRIADEAPQDPDPPSLERVKEVRSKRAATKPEGPSWPTYPHAPEGELGEVGADLPQQALTWMWHAKDAGDLFTTVVEHHLAQADAYSGLPMRLPKKVGPDTVACFGLFFPNYGGLLFQNPNGFRAVVGNVAFGRPRADARRFKMWNRKYSRSNLPFVVAALPGFAATGEAIVYWTMFAPCIAGSLANPREPRANPIPEFALFMEGHSAALSEMEDEPETLQQTWLIPVGEDGATGADLFADFLHEVQAISTAPVGLFRRPIRVQICDVKCLPKGHALLSSCPDGPAVAITLAVEDGKNYRTSPCLWGDPKKVFRDLSAKFWKRGVRVHLTKNIYVRPEDLAEMYGQRGARFRQLASQMDPDGLWGSQFLESTLP